MSINARVLRLERSLAERGCSACASEHAVVVPDLAASQSPDLARCARCGKPRIVKVLVGRCWSHA